MLEIKKIKDQDFVIKKLYEDFHVCLSPESFDNYVKRYDKTFPPVIYSFYKEKDFVGCAIINENMFEGEMISYFLIEKEHRKLGYGNFFLNYLINNKTKNYFLWCEEHNISFYEQIGFKDTKIVKKGLAEFNLMIIENKKISEIELDQIPII